MLGGTLDPVGRRVESKLIGRMEEVEGEGEKRDGGTRGEEGESMNRGREEERGSSVGGGLREGSEEGMMKGKETGMT